MPRRRRLVPACAGGLCLLVTGGCTLVKPVVGAVVGPAVFFAGSGGSVCNCDGRGVVAALTVAAVAGACVGVVTGVASDVQALSGAASNPTAYWWDPFRTNLSD